MNKQMVKRLWLMLLISWMVAATGCSRNQDNHRVSHIVYHHRPADYVAAVQRLDEIHQVLLSRNPLPPPKTFEDIRDHHDDGSHDDDDAGPTIAEVDIFREYFDIVRWLPAIAADSDLPKREWDQINAHCKSLQRLVQNLEQQLQSSTPSERGREELARQWYREQAAAFSAELAALRTKVETYQQWSEKNTTMRGY